MVRKHTRRRIAALAAIPLGLSAFAACSSGSSGSPESAGSVSAGGPGVEYGAGDSAYADALKDAKPIKLDFGGITSGPDSTATKAYMKYGDLVTKLSGGKITFKYDFGGAKVPLDQMVDGLRQGRVDMGLYIPQYKPAEWPVTSEITQIAMYTHDQPLLARAATFAAQVEFGQTWKPLKDESENHGLFPLYTLYSPSDLKLQCANGLKPLTSLADFKGKQIRVASPNQAALAQALGATPVSLTYPELFQGLQRGVVDCAVNTAAGTADAGFTDIIDSWTVGSAPAGDWGETPSGWGLSEKEWSKLPLAAQQLLWDTQPRMLEYMLEGGMRDTYKSVKASEDANVEIGTFGADVTKAVHAFNDEQEKKTAGKLEKLGATDDGASVVSDLKGAYDKWWKIVADQYPEYVDLNWENLTQRVGADVEEIDLAPITDRLFKEALLSARPR
jgi:TRAP-type C4-dicarboxylate transport system substrate-binding protein